MTRPQCAACVHKKGPGEWCDPGDQHVGPEVAECHAFALAPICVPEANRLAMNPERPN